MFCKNCGEELKNGESVCPKCGWSGTPQNQEKTSNGTGNKSSISINLNIIIKLALYIVAIVVICMSFNGANQIGKAAYNMRILRSVGGNSVAEAFYQYYGSFLYGVETFVRAVGIALGVIIAYIATTVKIYKKK